MNLYFICLANSYKRGGRCVAGIEISIDNNDHWKTVVQKDGLPRWIRPIDQRTEYGEIPESEARYIPIYSVVELIGVVPCPHESHSEDVYYQQMHSIGKILPTTKVLESFIDTAHLKIFYSTELAISPETYSQGSYSLMMIRPEGFQLHEDPTKNRAKYRMTFVFNGVTYDCSVTDPYFYNCLEQQQNLIESLKNIYLTLSIGLEYEGRHHKLIAAILIPQVSSLAMSPNTIVREEKLRLVSIRPFTKAECADCRRAFVVPSQQGLSVCVQKKSGGDDFILLDTNNFAELKQKINLKDTLVATYINLAGEETLRLRLRQQSHKNFIEKIIEKIRQL